MLSAAVRFHRLMVVLALCVFLAACNERAVLPTQTQTPAFAATLQNTPTATPTIPPTNTPTRTSTPIPTQTATPASTQTATIEPTWTPWPTSTPLVPMPAAEVKYRLTDWTPEKAERLIAELLNYPETILLHKRGYYDSFYYGSFGYAGMAQLEAALRFPQEPQKADWQWQGAYNSLQAFPKDVSGIYANLLANALNNDEFALADLKADFEAREPHLAIEITPLAPLPGYESSQILFIRPTDNLQCSGWVVWLLKDSSKYIVYPLEDERMICYGDGEIALGIEELTGDSIPEVVIRFVDWGSSSIHEGSFQIYQVSQVPPVRLQLKPVPAEVDIADWTALHEEGRTVGITLRIPIAIFSLFACGQFSPTWNYRWDGEVFEQSQLLPPTADEIKDDPRCTDIMIAHLATWARQGNPFALDVFNNFITQYPLSGSYLLGGWGFWPTQNELEFEVGVGLAALNDVSGARQQMQAILASPVITPTYLGKAANLFLGEYQAQGDLLDACLSIGRCYDVLSISQLAEIIPTTRFSETLDLMAQMGTPITYTGTYDFDQDGTAEYWLIDYDPKENYHDFWTITLDNGMVESRNGPSIEIPQRFTDTVRTEIVPLEPIGDIYPHRIISNENSYRFFFWKGDVAHPPITHREQGTRLAEIERNLLLAKILPEMAIYQLEELRSIPVTCFGDEENYPCRYDSYLQYLLALAYELAGEKDLAAQTYLALWQSFPDSPYAIMAMAKLEPVP
jgi:hypothetical protein